MNEGVQPGEELLKAVQVAEEHELPVALVDRDIQTTLRRAWKNMGFREKISLFSALIFDEEEEEIDLNEVLSDQDLLSSLMLELKEISPVQEKSSSMKEMSISLVKSHRLIQNKRYSQYWVLAI